MVTGAPRLSVPHNPALCAAITMSATITIQTRRGPFEVPTVWCGTHLAVHRVVKRDSDTDALTLSTAPARWAITHTATGLSASATFAGAKRRAVALAKLWDDAFADITASGTAKGWRWAQAWARDLQIAQHETYAEPLGPRDLSPLEDLNRARTSADVERAVWRAMGYAPAPEPEASEQYPAPVTKRTAGAGAVRRNPDSGALELWWLPHGGNYPFGDAIALAGWYEVPALADVERWCLGSVAETPSGDRVEPDHPDAWPRLLGVM